MRMSGMGVLVVKARSVRLGLEFAGLYAGRSERDAAGVFY